jgi:hypothetical protein
LNRNHDGQSDEGQQEVVEGLHGVAHRLGDDRVEGEQEELLVAEHHCRQDDCRQDAHNEEIGRRYPQDIPEQEAEKIRRVALDRTHEQDAQGERPGEQDADGRVETRAGPPRYETDAERGSHREDRGTQIDVGLQHIGDHDPGEGGVGQGVANEGQPAQHNIGPDHGADRSHQDTAHQGALHEAELPGSRQEFHHFSAASEGVSTNDQ